MNGNITGSGRIIQAGAGTTTLNGTNVLSALSGNAVTVNAGTLIMNGGSYRANVNDGKAIVVTNGSAQLFNNVTLTNVTLTTTDGGGSGNSASTSGAFGVSVSGPAASVTGNNVTMDTMGTGLWVSGGASATVSQLNLTMRATGNVQGPLASNAGIWTEGVNSDQRSTASVSNSTIILTGNGTAAVYATGSSTITLNSVNITSAGTNSIGLAAVTNFLGGRPGGSSIVNATNVSVTMTGNNSPAAYVGSGGQMTLDGTTLTTGVAGDPTQGVSSYGISIDGGVATLSNVGITTTGAGAHGAHVQVGGTLELIGSTIAVTGPGANAIFTTLGTAANPNEISVTRGSLSSAHADLIQATNAHSNITLNALTASSSLGNLLLNINSSSTVNFVANGSTLTGDTFIQGGSTANITANSSVWTGNILTDETSTAQINLVANSVLTGMIDPASLAVDGTSTWNVTADSILSNIDVSAGGKVLILPPAPGFKNITITRNLTGGGLFGMNTNLAALRGDHIDVQGTSAGSHSVLIANTGGTPTGPGQALEIISTADGAANFALANPGQHVDAGMYSYRLRRGNNAGKTPDPTNWYLVNDFVPDGGGGSSGGGGSGGGGGGGGSGGGGSGPGSGGYPALSPVGRAIVSSGTGVIGTFWLTQFDMLHKRMGDLRLLHGNHEERNEISNRRLGPRIRPADQGRYFDERWSVRRIRVGHRCRC